MGESNIDIILKTKREGSGVTDQAVNDLKELQSGLTNLEKSTLGTRTTIGGLDKDITAFGTNMGSASDFASGLGLNLPVTKMMLFGDAVRLAGQYVADSIKDLTSYYTQVETISRYTGMGVEETSRLIQVSDDLRIEVSTVEQAMKSMAQNGTVPSIEGLGRLSDEYISIQDPLQKAQFLTDNFGRAGVDMAKMMTMGADAIRSAADEVNKWMIITGESQTQIEAYLSGVDNLEDSFQGLQYQVGKAVIPPLTDLLNTLNKGSEEVEEGGAQWMRYIPILSTARVAFLGVKAYIEETTGTVSAQTEEVDKLGQSWQNAAVDAQTYGNTSRGNINNRANVHNPGDEGYNPSGEWGSGRASGGPILPGTIYKVGERETEFITVGAPGTVTPSGGETPVVTIFYSPAVSLGDRNEAEQVLIPLVKAALRHGSYY